MGAKGRPISAVVSSTTKQRLETYLRASGMDEDRVIEAAIDHHLQAIQNLPLDVIVHPRLVVSRRSGERLLRRTRSRKATVPLRRLMAGHGD